jgi:CBS domain-containing membrane protein
MSSGPRYPIGGKMSDVVLGLAQRFRLTPLMQRYNSTVVLGMFALLNGFISIALMAFAAYITGQPLIFPSLGPTAFLLFYTPDAAAASPRNTVFGHLIGVVVGYLSLAIFGLLDVGPALSVGVSASRVAAAGLSLGLTAGCMVWFRVPHPPAGATTLIISLGILRTPVQMVVLMLAVMLLVVQGFVINRLAGLNYPLWAPPAPERKNLP